MRIVHPITRLRPLHREFAGGLVCRGESSGVDRGHVRQAPRADSTFGLNGRSAPVGRVLGPLPHSPRGRRGLPLTLGGADEGE